jgi:hypothetical protein
MTFDELCRMNLTEHKKRIDSASGGATQTMDEESRDELALTDEDRAFLLQVGIRHRIDERRDDTRVHFDDWQQRTSK